MSKQKIEKILANIKSLAINIQNSLSANLDILDSTNQLVANTITLTFTVGELYALQSGNFSCQSKVKYHNIRDSKGRFVKNAIVKL